MARPLICAALGATALLLSPAPAAAGESYDNCTGFITSLPATIGTQGVWCLDRDLSTNLSEGNAITIAANNVILDCNHFRIGGLAAGSGTSALGVHALDRLNALVRNCSIRGFYRGIFFLSGSGHLVENNRFEGNTTTGIRVDAANSTVRRNLVLNTGGSTYVPGNAHGIWATGGVDVLDNTVNGVAPISPGSGAIGIYSLQNGEGNINGNRVRGLAATDQGSAIGIHFHGSAGAIARDNDVRGPGTSATGIGILCSVFASTAHDNVISRFETGVGSCIAGSNVVNPN